LLSIFATVALVEGVKVRLEVVGRGLDRLEMEVFDGAFEDGSA
jgi:hypothetical protein